jgi:hypothetical protein
MRNTLKQIASGYGYILYKRVARNGSSACAWVGGPAYGLYDHSTEDVKHVGDFDWETEAMRAFEDVASKRAHNRQ